MTALITLRKEQSWSPSKEIKDWGISQTVDELTEYSPCHLRDRYMHIL